MKMIVPRQFATDLNGERSLPSIAHDAAARLSDGLDAKVVIAWAEKEGCSAEFANWLIPFLDKHGIPDDIKLEEEDTDVEIILVDGSLLTAKPSLVIDVPAKGTNRRVVITGPVAAPPVAAPPVAAPPVAAPPVAAPPVAAQVKEVTGWKPVQSPDLPSAEYLRLSPLAEAFPEWNVMPPVALIKRVRRTL